jgi:iron-sulfur cluster assembly accessory protein
MSKLRQLRSAIDITERAAVRLKTMITQHSEPVTGIRVGVRRRGCNGLSYTMNYSKAGEPKDEVVTKHGVTIFIDPKAIMHVVGTTMDWVEDDITAEFKFNNPNAKGQCGCGESFNT